MLFMGQTGLNKLDTVWSSIGQFLTLLMLLVGAALFVHYNINQPSPSEQALFDQSKDYVFPTWITTTLPVGLRGLIIAAIFAAAISSLDSILAALSQTTLALFIDPSSAVKNGKNPAFLLRVSRYLVVVWGIILSLCAIGLDELRGNINMVDLAFGMIAYTTGPLLGLFLAALLAHRRRSSARGLFIGCIISIFMVLLVRVDIYKIMINLNWISLDNLLSYKWLPIEVTASGISPVVHYAWMWPVTCLITLGAGFLFPVKKHDSI